MFRNGLIFLFIFLLFLEGCAKNRNGFNNDEAANTGSQSAFKAFMFVGMIDKRPGLYVYNFTDKKYLPFWSKRNESVIDLSYSKDMKTAFFITASSYGKRGAFPFVDRAKIYLLSSDSTKPKFIERIGNALQIYTAWGTDNTFKVIVNSFDPVVVNYINQHTRILNTFGKVLLDEVKTYDLTKDGYPKPPVLVNDYSSPSGNYFVSISGAGKGKMFLIEKKSRKKNFIAAPDQTLKRVEWSNDENYLFVSTLDISPSNYSLKKKSPETSKLYIYSLKDNKVVQSFGGGGLKNFFVDNNLLVFDDGFNGSSSINIFNFKTLKLQNEIVIKGGSGLRNIPTIPDYGTK